MKDLMLGEEGINSLSKIAEEIIGGKIQKL